MKEKRDDTVEKRSYQRMVDRLIFLSHTRPNIAYAVNVEPTYA